MIYEKLPALFLSILAGEKNGSTNSVIADYILCHQTEVGSMGIRELAEECHVGTGSVSRFCRDYGFHDFSELKRLLKETSFHYDAFMPSAGAAERTAAWAERMKQVVSRTGQSVETGRLREIARDMHQYSRISAYGMLKAESAAISLQTDMLMMGRKVSTAVSYTEQIDRILQADREDLIIIFSYTGSYFDYFRFGRKEKQLYLPRIWMICGTTKKMPEYVNGVIRFDSDLDQFSHPFQLEMTASLIAGEYAALTETNDEA